MYFHRPMDTWVEVVVGMGSTGSMGNQGSQSQWAGLAAAAI